jgi:hypothetical protein
LAGLARRARLVAIECDLAVVNDRVADGVGAAMRYVRVVTGTADRISPADDRRDYRCVALRETIAWSTIFCPLASMA